MACKKIAGTNGRTGNFKTIKFAQHCYIDVLEYPNRVIDGWRHANVVLKQSSLIQYCSAILCELVSAAIWRGFDGMSHVAADSQPFVTMEWHTKGTRTEPIKTNTTQVRLYIAATHWPAVRAMLEQALDEYLANNGQHTLSVDLPCSKRIIDNRHQQYHRDELQLELQDIVDLRQALSIVQQVWRREDAAAPPVRLMVFSGTINGRQMPNKSMDHQTLLTDQVTKVSVSRQGKSANIAGATACQEVSRICTVTFLVLNNPLVWSNSDTERWVREHHELQLEFGACIG